MKKFLEGIFFTAVIAVIGYIMVSTAAKHTALDNAAMLQWKYEHAVR
jgi:hypothetical protein